MENMGTVMLLAIVFLIVATAVWGYNHVNLHHRKLMEYFDSIKIGDRYFFTIEPEHPFEEAKTYTGTIINKKLVGGKHPWVQYRYEDGSVGQDELHEFLTFHEKING